MAQKLQSQSMDALMASLNLAVRDELRPPESYRDQVLAAFKTLRKKEEQPFQSKTNWPGSKNSETAASRRWHANKMLSKPRKAVDRREVLVLLTQCIAALPYPTEVGVASCGDPTEEGGVSGEELAAAFAARAGFFLQTHEYALCVADLERALDVFPRASEPIRKQWAATKGTALARQALKTRITNDLSVQDHLVGLVAMAPDIIPAGLSFPEHPVLAGAAACLEVRADPKQVTRLVANADIHIGDVILMEKPFASVLSTECFVSHCFHCLTNHSDMIPCKTCSVVLYCCKVCRDADTSLFHQWECRLLGTLLHSFGTSLSWLPALALRIFLTAVYTQRGLEPLLDFTTFLDSQGFEKTRGFDSEGRYELPSGFTTIHFSTRGSSLNTELPHIAAVLLLGLDSLTSFFQRYPADVDKKMQVGALLLRYAVVARDLVFKVNNVSPPHDGKWRLFAVAAAVFPVAGLARRSCAANTISAFRGDNLLLMATAEIATGQEVTISSGVSYTSHDLASRQASLTNFPGECRCEACLEQWPTMEALSRLQSTYRCVKCSAELPFELGTAATDVLVHCSRCHTPNNILTNKIEEQEVTSLLRGIRQKMSTNHTPALFAADLISALTRLSSFLRPPDYQLAAVVQLLQDSVSHGGQGNKLRPLDGAGNKPLPLDSDAGNKPLPLDSDAGNKPLPLDNGASNKLRPVEGDVENCQGSDVAESGSL